jgi:hypothetical protein
VNTSQNNLQLQSINSTGLPPKSLPQPRSVLPESLERFDAGAGKLKIEKARL